MQRLVMVGMLAIFVGCRADAATWVEYKTDNFIVYSAAKEELTRKFIDDLEAFRYFLLRANRVSSANSAVPLTLYITNNRTSYRKLTGSDTTAGKYTNTNRGPAAIAIGAKNNWKLALDPREILFHEYVHYVMFQYSGRWFPKWYSEGLADYLSTFSYKDNVLTLGALALNRLWALRKTGRWVPVEELLSARTSSVRKGDTDLFYSQSWYLTHFLNHHPDFKGKLEPLLAAQASGLSAKDAVQSALGISSEKLDELLLQQWEKREMLMIRVNIDSSFRYELGVRQLEKEEGRVIEAQIVSSFHEQDGKEKKLLKALYKYPSSDRMKDIVASYYAREKDWQKALDILGEVTPTSSLRLRRAHALMSIYKSSENYSSPPNLSAADMAQARRNLIRSVNQKMNDVEGRFAYSFSYLGRYTLEGLPKNKQNIVRANMQLAYSLAPQRSDIGYWYAVMLRRLDRSGEACHVIKALVDKLDLTPREVNNYKRTFDMPLDDAITCVS